MLPLDAVREIKLHVVAQVIESKLVVCAVGDVGAVALAPLLFSQIMDDHAHLQTQETVQLAHPFGVAPRQVVVHGNDMNALAFQRVQVGR